MITNHRIPKRLALLLLVTFNLQLSAFAQIYNVTDLGTGTYPTGINDSGQVVGNTTLNGEGVEGINDSGQIVGWSYSGGLPTGQPQAWLYSGGVTTWLGTLDTRQGEISSSEAYGINNNGEVVGVSGTASLVNEAFLYNIATGTMVGLGIPSGYVSSWAYGINDNGQVVGSASPEFGGQIAFLLSGSGGPTALGTLGYSYSCAYGINDNGQIVGSAFGPYGPNVYGTAFLYSGGEMVDLNTLIPANSGWTLKSADGINNNGQIVGWGSNPSGQTDAFLLMPIPEPAVCVLLALGSLAFLFRRR